MLDNKINEIIEIDRQIVKLQEKREKLYRARKCRFFIIGTPKPTNTMYKPTEVQPVNLGNRSFNTFEREEDAIEYIERNQNALRWQFTVLKVDGNGILSIVNP